MNDHIPISEKADAGEALLNAGCFLSQKQRQHGRAAGKGTLFHLVFLETGRFAFLYKELDLPPGDTPGILGAGPTQEAFPAHSPRTAVIFTGFPEFLAALKPGDLGYIDAPQRVWNEGRHPAVLLNETPALEYLFFCLWNYLLVRGMKNTEFIAMHAEFSRFVRTILSRMRVANPISEDLRKRHVSTIRRGKEFIFRNFQNDFSIPELAAYCYISPFYFSRMFKDFTGYTPARYIQTIRMKQAALLLQGTRLSLLDICAYSGFKRPDYFSAVFKRTFGVAPSLYRTHGLLTQKEAGPCN
jgi:AraC-like DNA-binding protein